MKLYCIVLYYILESNIVAVKPEEAPQKYFENEKGRSRCAFPIEENQPVLTSIVDNFEQSCFQYLSILLKVSWCARNVPPWAESQLQDFLVHHASHLQAASDCRAQSDWFQPLPPHNVTIDCTLAASIFSCRGFTVHALAAWQPLTCGNSSFALSAIITFSQHSSAKVRQVITFGSPGQIQHV